jgi:stage II sporulation protein E
MYGHQLKAYKKTGTECLKEKEEWGVMLFSKEALLVYGCAFLMGRTVIIGGLSPFGIGFFAAIYITLGRGYAILSAVAAAVGYMCTVSFTHGLWHACVILMLASIFSGTRLRDRQKPAAVLTGVFFISFFAFLLFNIIVKQPYSTRYSIIMAGVEAVLAAGLGYIFSYGVPLYFRIRKRKLLTREEWTCISFMAAVLLGGFWNIGFGEVSLRRIMAVFLTMAIGYMEGPSQGTFTGVMLGLVLSLTGGAEMSYIGVYGISGLASGIFKRKNKLFSSLAFIAGYILITSYNTNGIISPEHIAELLIGTAAFLIIKRTLYEKAAFMMDGEERGLEMQRQYSQRVQEIMGSRLCEIATTLTDLSEILNETADKDIFRKSEVDGVVESIADKVCAACEGRNLCWKKEFYKTYDSFKMLMEYAEKRGRVSLKDMPQALQGKCIKANELVRQVNAVFEIFKLNSRWRRKIFNSRRIVGQQLESISQMVKGMASDVGTSFEFKNDLEEGICAALDKAGLEFDDVIAVKDRHGKYEVSIYRTPCMGKQSCSREYAVTITKTLGVKMVKDSLKCRLNSDCSLCQFRLVEAECFNIASAVAQRSIGEACGDCCLHDSINRGRYMLAISDGMGSGRAAAMESGVTISLLEKFMTAGYERNSAIKAINSVLLLRSCEENYATIDLGIIDLYNGVGEFIKIGSATTFIKSGDEVCTLRSSSLPVGIVDDIEVESEIIELKDGDLIIMVTDGVEDSMGLENEKWLDEAIGSLESGNPRDIADRLLHMAEENYNGEAMDDMTVLVSKIWKQYD